MIDLRELTKLLIFIGLCFLILIFYNFLGTLIVNNFVNTSYEKAKSLNSIQAYEDFLIKQSFSEKSSSDFLGYESSKNYNFKFKILDQAADQILSSKKLEVIINEYSGDLKYASSALKKDLEYEAKIRVALSKLQNKRVIFTFYADALSDEYVVKDRINYTSIECYSGVKGFFIVQLVDTLKKELLDTYRIEYNDFPDFQIGSAQCKDSRDALYPELFRIPFETFQNYLNSM